MNPPLTPEEAQALLAWRRWVHRWELAGPARLCVGAARPLLGLGAVWLNIMVPVGDIWGGGALGRGFARLLERHDAVERLTQALRDEA